MRHVVRVIDLFVLLLSSVLMLGGSARAFDGGGSEDPRVGYYSSENGDVGFILDRSHETARLRFDDSKEILLLDMVPGPRGDMFLKDETGITVLRLMPFGGATYYDDEQAVGEAFGRAAGADPLALEIHTQGEIKTRMGAVSKRLDQEFGLDIPLVTHWGEEIVDEATMAILWDAVNNTGNALVDMAHDDDSRNALAQKIVRVSFEVGETKQLRLESQDLVIVYAQNGGLEGRPSSRAIQLFLKNNL